MQKTISNSATSLKKIMKMPNLSNQALLSLVGYALLMIALFMPTTKTSTVTGEKSPEGIDEKSFNAKLLVFLFSIIPIVLSIYTIDCLMKGECTMWSWINSIVVFAWCLVVFIISLLLQFGYKM